jgi:putative flippase GtrA
MQFLKLPDRTTQLRFFRFLVVGGISAGVRFAALALAQNFLKPSFTFSFAFICSTTTHYLLNRFWALRSTREDVGQQMGEYLLTVVISYGINLLMFKFCHAVLGLSVVASGLWAIPPSTVVVFLILHLRVFQTKIPGDKKNG